MMSYYSNKRVRNQEKKIFRNSKSQGIIPIEIITTSESEVFQACYLVSLVKEDPGVECQEALQKSNEVH